MGGRVVLTFHLFCPRLQSLQNKIRNETAPLPQINDELALRPKRTIFSIIDMGGRVVLSFHLFCPRVQS